MTVQINMPALDPVSMGILVLGGIMIAAIKGYVRITMQRTACEHQKTTCRTFSRHQSFSETKDGIIAEGPPNEKMPK